jgi:polyferredoxin
MFAAFLLAVGFGPVICGWVCPLGTFQEWLGKIGRKIFGKRYNNFIPGRLDNYLRYLRYFILAWVLYVTATTTKLFFQTLIPTMLFLISGLKKLRSPLWLFSGSRFSCPCW